MNEPVTLKINADRLIMQALEEDITSEDISTNAERKMRVYCKPFRDELIAANDLDPEKPFLVEGEYKDALNAVVFPLKVF